MSDKSVNRRINIWINDKNIENSFKSLNSELRKQSTLLRGMTRGSKDYNLQLKKVNNLKGALQGHRNDLRGVNKSWSTLKATMGGFLLAGGIVGLVQGAIRGFKKLISVNADLSDSFADVMKTTGLTRKEIGELDKDLRKLDTRTPRKKLLDLARDAGKLGIQGKKNILDFVEAADKIQVALGEDLGEGAIKNIGKLNEVFKITKKLGVAKGMEATGSAINALGQASTANEEFIVSFTQRMGGLSEQADITLEDTLGLAAAVDQLGLTSELSSTAISKTILAMFKDTASFAEIAGVSTEEFTKLLNEDTNEALMIMLKGLNGNNEGLGVLSGKLDKVGLDGARAVQTLASLAGNLDVVAEAQSLANDEFEKATSLTDEFNVKNNNFAGNLAKIGKQLTDIWANSKLLSSLTRITGLVTKFLSFPLAEKLEGERIEMNRLANAALNANTSQEDRNRLIGELITNYPEYLGHLDKEKTTNEELAIAISNANDFMVDKIELTIRESRVLEAANKSAEAKVNAMDNEVTLARKLIEINDKYKLGIDLTTGTLEEQYALVKAAAADKGISGNDNWAAKAALNVGYLNTALLINKVTATEDEKVIGELFQAHAAFAVSTNRSRIESELLDAVINDNIESITLLKSKLNELSGAGGSEDSTTPTGGLSDAEIEKERVRQEKWAKLKADFSDEMYLALLSADDRELELEQRKWDEMIVKAETYGFDITNLANARSEALEDIDDKHKAKLAAAEEKAAKEKQDVLDAEAEAEEEFEKAKFEYKMQVARSTSQILGTAVNFIGKQGEELGEFQKSLALAQIAIDTGSSIATAVSLGIKSTIPGPLAPFQTAANIAALMVTIFSGINAAKNVLQTADVPKFEATPIPQYATGTNFHPGGRAIVGEQGPEEVELPRGSKVFTHAQTIARMQMNVPAAISAVRAEAGFSEPDQTDSPTFEQASSTGSDGAASWGAELIAAINTIGSKLDKYEREKQIILSNKQFKKDQARMEARQNMRDMG